MVVIMKSRTGRQFQRYNIDGRRQVVGCIPYRYNDSDELEVLLISSQKKKDGQMLFPKGGWETDESITEAAARETFEEAGIRGVVKYDLGSWMFKSKRYGTYYEGSMFSLFVKEELDSWPEKDVRTRRWMTVKEAKQVCQHWWMNAAVDELVEHLDAHRVRLVKGLDVEPRGTSTKMFKLAAGDEFLSELASGCGLVYGILDKECWTRFLFQTQFLK